MKELRGVRVVLETGANHNVFREFAAPVPFEKLDWAMGDWFEVYPDEGGSLGESLDWSETLSGRELKALVAKFAFAYHASFIGYPPGTPNMRELDDYDQFVNSKAEMVILLLDNRYFDFYCKDESVTRAIAEHLRQCGVTWEYIDENDYRTRLTL